MSDLHCNYISDEVIYYYPKTEGVIIIIPGKYAIYESKEAMELYIEFVNIPGNKFSFEVPPDVPITCELMHDLLNTAYKLVGQSTYSS